MAGLHRPVRLSLALLDVRWEHDAAGMMPPVQELRGRIGGRFAETTTPAVVAATLDVVAAALGRSKAEVAAATYANAAAVFDPTQWREGGSRGEEDGQAAAAEAVAAGL